MFCLVLKCVLLLAATARNHSVSMHRTFQISQFHRHAPVSWRFSLSDHVDAGLQELSHQCPPLPTDPPLFPPPLHLLGLTLQVLPAAANDTSNAGSARNLLQVSLGGTLGFVLLLLTLV